MSTLQGQLNPNLLKCVLFGKNAKYNDTIFYIAWKVWNEVKELRAVAEYICIHLFLDFIVI